VRALAVVACVVTRFARARARSLDRDARSSRALPVKKHFCIVASAPRGLTSARRLRAQRVAARGPNAFLRGFLRRLVRPMVNLSTGT